ncbi:starch synthase, chloroplastic/amyloplastic, partial [Haematococcus lacustris]
VVVLGSGAQDYEAAMKQAQLDYPYFVRCITKFDVPLSHRIIASCDILMMPSRFEPCGLNQLFAMRYGTIPVAHSTGGLRDTIDDYNTFADPGSRDRGTGWTFSPASLEAFVDALTAAIKVLQEQPGEWRALQRRAMQQDLSWGKAARQYEIVYAGVMRQQQEKRADLEAKGSQALARQEAQLKLEAAEAERAAAAAKKAEAEAKVLVLVLEAGKDRLMPGGATQADFNQAD